MKVLKVFAACLVLILWLLAVFGLISAGIHGVQEVWGLL